MFSKIRAAWRAYADGGLEELCWRTAYFYLAPPEWIGLIALQNGMSSLISVGTGAISRGWLRRRLGHSVVCSLLNRIQKISLGSGRTGVILQPSKSFQRR